MTGSTPERPQTILAAAQTRNSAVLRPLSEVTYQRLSASAGQANTATEFLGRTSSDAIGPRVGFEALLNLLRFDPEARVTEVFERAFRDLGLHLGPGGSAARARHP